MSIYLRWYRKHSRSFNPFGKILILRGSDDTVDCFHRVDSEGLKDPTPRHPRLLSGVLQGKKNLNWQIRQWSEGLMEVPMFELKESYPWLPDWVWKSVWNQFQKRTLDPGGHLK